MNNKTMNAFEVEQVVCKKILPKLQKATRYLGHEHNAVHRDHTLVNVRTLLAFPDVYEVGMSYVGFKILYALINARHDWLAERAFCPWPDMEEEMITHDVPLYGLESFNPAANYDIIGFTLQYEMSYTNILNMLKLSKIPLLSKDRNEHHPLVIAGGPCVSNPEPIAEFFDVFCLLDGEEVIKPLFEEYQISKELNEDRTTLLKRLAKLDGIYVPSLYTPIYNDDGSFKDLKPNNADVPTVVKRAAVADLDKALFPKELVMPYTEAIHDRIALEAMRGCTRGCRFCQAGMIYRPVRERSKENLCDLARSLVKSTGYEEMSVLSLSSADYTDIASLLGSLANEHKERGIAVSLPSLRADAFSIELAKEIQKLRRTGLTFAPEAGTQRMRDRINKGVTEEDLFGAVKDAFASGWTSVKLYFMIGLPYEEDEDIVGIAELSKKVLALAKESASPKTRGRVKVSVSVSTLVPKSHTPFQWFGQNTRKEIERKQNILRANIQNRDISLAWHDMNVSSLEAAIARGDRKLSKVILKAHELGCKFDGWSEFFDFNKWLIAFSECNMTIEEYANKDFKLFEKLPWDHIHMGVEKQFLLDELDKAEKLELTSDCRDNDCHNCGACDEKLTIRKCNRTEKEKSTKESKLKTDSQIKIRVKVTKEGYARFVSHLEYIRAVERAIRRAGLKIAFSEGFHPHAKISFSPAISVGHSSSDEYIDMALTDKTPVEEVVKSLDEAFPDGIKVCSACEIIKGDNVSAIIDYATYNVKIEEDLEMISSALDEFLSKDSFMATKKTKSGIKEVDIRPLVRSAEINHDFLSFTIACGSRANLRADDFLNCIYRLAGIKENENSVWFHRSGLFVEDGGKLVPPIEYAGKDICYTKARS